ncbi:MAG: TonB-dependent receptor [Bacteroidales bacterium]|nr:TonB-dependent receptor [Bacteroidales bacterium]
MKFSSNLLLLCILTFAGVSTLWGAVINGIVTDDENSELPGALVRLTSLPDSVQTEGQLTDIDGKFEFKNVRPGLINLQVSMTGMEPIVKDITVNSDQDTIFVGRLRISENPVLLDEAVVTAIRAAVVAKEDTLEYNAGSFHTSPNASVEDLLKKLPGVEVGSDGSITSQGKTISKILVDGKEFFGDDPKAATKNLPSNMVDKVQVVDRKSETARLTGVDDGEDETVINLTVKKDMNNGWFGTVGAGYGTDSRYQGNFNVNYFKDGNQVSLIGGANNINEMGFTDRGRGRFRDFGGNNGINSTRQAGINFNVGNEEKFRVGGSIFYTNTDRDSRSRFETQYLFPDSVSYLNGGSRNRDRGQALNAQFRMRWNITEADVLDFRPEFSYNYRHSEKLDSSFLRAGNKTYDLVNSNNSMQRNRGRDWTASGRMIYTHKFLNRPGRSFSAQLNYSFSDTRQHSTSWNDIEYFLRQEDSERLFQFIDSRQWSNNLEGRLTWTEPLGDSSRGNYLEFAYRGSIRFNNADKLTYDLPSDISDILSNGLPDYNHAPEDAVLSNDLSNRFRNKFSNQELQIGYKKITKSLNLNAGLTLSPSSSESEDLINSARNIDTRWVWNVAPYLRVRYKFDASTSLMANYRARTTQPSITQLQPVADTSDPLNITVGNPDLKPTFTQNLGFHFNRFNATSQQSLVAAANASFALNNIVSRTITDPQTGVRTTTYANSNGNWNVFGMLMLNQPLRNRKWRVNARFNGRYASTAGYINGDYNRSGNLTLSPAAGITFSSDIFQMTLTPTYSFQMTTSTLQRQMNRDIHSYGFNTDASLFLPFGLEVNTDLAFSRSSGYSYGFDSSQLLWNARLSYSFLPDKSLTLSVNAYDLLGRKKNISRSVSADIITDREYNDLTRYVMVGLTWKFNTLSKKAKASIEDSMHGPGMPPDDRRGGSTRGGDRPHPRMSPGGPDGPRPF